MTDATTTPAGRVILVGGGPGAPGLLTVAGCDALAAADVVVTDRLAPLAAIAEHAPQAEVVHVGKIPRGAFTPQERINELLLEHARAGRTVVRLKGGDGYLFGRGGEEWNACTDAGIPVEIVPGVSSAFSVPALAGIPVTHRGLSQGVAVVSGHVSPDDPRSEVDWAALATSRLTIVVLMGVATLGSIAEALMAAGLPADTPAACVADGASPQQRVVRAPVSQIATEADAGGFAPPAITVIGQVVEALHGVS
ncbi:uroporphyrinogen-III C-methyltransferase [Janibacter terrae]|uniref:uroporphyrinogen-III C-methyltransferase n=1 Tax=Janibacter terrae TaxID=103817 RepID=UPI0031F8A768